jgi:hypothetical protein
MTALTLDLPDEKLRSLKEPSKNNLNNSRSETTFCAWMQSG